MRTPSPRRALTLLGAAALLGAGPLVASTGASAAQTHPTITAGACHGKTGVTEVVDFTKLGGTVEVHCDYGTPKTGLAALTGAGFTYSFVPKIPGFICRIDKLPNPCNGAPAKAYWGYWHAAAHGTWKFSNKGAGSYKPPAGSVEGWAFGNGQKPSIAPPN